MNEIEIHDIKQLVDIPDFSLYIYLTLWILGVILFFIFIFLLFKYFKYRKKIKENTIIKH